MTVGDLKRVLDNYDDDDTVMLETPRGVKFTEGHAERPQYRQPGTMVLQSEEVWLAYGPRPV